MSVRMGFAPYVPAHRPRAEPRWWVARSDGGAVTLAESAEPPAPEGTCGIAAPMTLPDEFLAFLEQRNRSLDRLTLDRLLALARAFAMERERGKKHPRRHEHETLSALDRRALPLFFAARPLRAAQPREVDVSAFLKSRGLPATGLSGAGTEAVDRRAQVLAGLDIEEIDLHDRDYAIASFDALRALVALAALVAMS